MGENAYLGLRARVLAVDPADVGIAADERHPRVWGALFETGFPQGSMTLLCLADGTTSLYLSNGGGVLGAGQHQQIAEATWAFLDVLQHDDRFAPDPDDTLPRAGEVVVRALTYDGRLRFAAPEDSLHEDPVFLAAHGVITQLRLQQQGG